MPTLNFALDTRGAAVKARPLKARAAAGRAVQLLFAVKDVRLTARQWDAARQQAVAVSARPTEREFVARVNQRLLALRTAFEQAVQELPLTAEGLTSATLRRALNPRPEERPAPVLRLTLPAALRRRAADKRGYEAPATGAAYERLAARVEEFAKRLGLPGEYLRLAATAELPGAEVSGALLLRLRDWLFQRTGATNDTVNNALHKLKAALKHVALRYPQELGGEAGQQRALLLRSLVEPLPSELPDIFCPTAEELAWLQAADCPDALRLTRDRWLLSAGTGLRHSDLARATREQLRATPEGDVDLHYLPQKTKARQATIIPLGRGALEIIRYYQALHPEAPWLVPPQDNRRDNELTHQWLLACGPPSLHEAVVRRRYYGAAFTDEHLPRWRAITFHSARHCYATRLTGAGGDLRTVQLLLGHRSSRSTLRYARDGQAALSATAGRALLHGPNNS